MSGYKENTNLGSKMEGAYALDRRADSLALGCEQEESISLPVFLSGWWPPKRSQLTGAVLEVLGVALHGEGKGQEDQFAASPSLTQSDISATHLGGVDSLVALLALEGTLRVAEALLADL